MNTKNKSKKGIIGIALAAIMIASIFAVLPLPVLSDISGKECEHPQPGGLVVDIVYPANGTTYEYCDNFYVNAVIANMNDTLNFENVLVNITILGGTAELVPVGSGDDFDSKSLGTLSKLTVVDVWWELHCNGAGPVNITVEATSTTDSIYNSSEDSVTVEQIDEPVTPVLEIEIFQYPTEMIEVCDVFAIKANITNIGYYTLNDVTANITWDPASGAELRNCTNWTLGTMERDEMHEVGWTLHCEEPGYLNVTVGATASGIDVERIRKDSVIVHQKTPANLNVTITAPDNESKICTECDNLFPLSATVENTGDEATTGQVEVKVNVTEGVDYILINGQKPTGTPHFTRVIVPNLPAGASETVTWNLTCNGTGTVALEVIASGYNVNGAITDTDTCTIYQNDLIVEILEPANSSTYSTCQDFDVVAMIKNCLDTALTGDDINVTLDFRGLGANLTTTTVSIETSTDMAWVNTELTMTKLEEGLYYVLLEEPFCDCCWANLTWGMECIDESDGTIEVYAENASDTNINDSDSVYIIQEWKADLAAGVEFYRGVVDLDDPESDMFLTTPVGAVTVCQNFSVVVPVINWGEAAAENVSVGITVSGPATLLNGTLTQDLGTIEGNESAKAIWNFHCDAEGEISVTVPRDLLTGTDENTGVEVLSENKYVPPCPATLDQIPFTVEIIEPITCTDFLVGQQWTVKVNLSNDDSDEPLITLKDLYATIHYNYSNEHVKLAEGQERTVYIEELEPGQWTHAPTWQMNCTGEGEVYIYVEVTSTTPAHTIYSDEVNVHQKLPADVTVEILSPGECTFIATSTEFMVTAKISNAWHCLDADISPYVSVSGATKVSGPDPAAPITLSEGESQIVNWVYHCDESVDLDPCANTTIYVYADWTDTAGKTGSKYDYVDIHQYPAAHLEVEIDVPDDGSRKAFGSDFRVNATITNTGEADVWEGKATLSVVPENSLLLAEGGYTKDLGALVGHGEDGSAKVSWLVQCEELGKSTITVDVSGKDEFGYHLKQCDCEDDCPCDGMDCTYEPAMEPGRAIPEDHIEPASITVKQVTEEDLVEPFGDNITLVTGWNFISVPKRMDSTKDTWGELITISVAQILKYDAATSSWLSQGTGDPVEVLEGYWVYANDVGTITLVYKTGGQMVPPSKDLTGKAWNAIGFSSVTAKSASTTLKSVEGSWSTVIGWDETGQHYGGAIIYEVNDEELMYPGKGYWDWMTADDTLSALSA